MRSQTLAPQAQTLPQKAHDPLRSLRVSLKTRRLFGGKVSPEIRRPKPESSNGEDLLNHGTPKRDPNFDNHPNNGLTSS